MLIRCLFIFAGIFLVRPAIAQTVAIGLRGGLGQACHQRYFEKDYGGYFPLRPLLSKTIGLNATFGIGTHLALEAGLNYEEKGNIRYAYKNQYHYISLPITLKWHLLAERTILPYVRGGVYYAHLLHHQQTPINDGPIFYIYLPEYQTPAVKDVGLVAAIGADWQLPSRIQLNIDLAGTRGRRNLYASDASSLALPYPLYNISWSWTMGVRYVL